MENFVQGRYTDRDRQGFVEGNEIMSLLPMDIDILPASDDRVFKLILTSPESKPVLIDLIAATIRRPVVDVEVRGNELPLGDTEEKAERLDVNCRIDDGSQVDLEMQASYVGETGGGHKNIKGKSIYYLCDLHSSQSSKGRRYDELVQTYQVTFCSYTVFPELPDYVNTFSMRHETTNELLSDAIHVIYVELSKLKEIIKKSVDDMTDLEKWAVFFRYADIPEYRETVNKVIESKEALQMAGNLLMSVSKDENERAVFRSRRMYQSDLESNIATAEYRGEQRGIQIGEEKKALSIARNLLGMNVPLDQIVTATGLTSEEVESLRTNL
jgi:predicted transposase/invertase (TIGR01784 family)